MELVVSPHYKQQQPLAASVPQSALSSTQDGRIPTRPHKHTAKKSETSHGKKQGTKQKALCIRGQQ